ncbi:MAG: hypothetical protein GWM98_22275, partial [Nitrospinaceae bacterium]|nr:hypothetical protein [Nitrospinaceae bacterium]NIR56682.1 hypothetical protein [Nitrospinaceae bacterium]NIS87145.1 hypothetical protein [Nitrospinaceae bacterium]NIT83999.1 hypothetical protein [Nitrospinaceae bacterium]NIU46189.1 hypothetical protein [Nitrospinaceae bacterium]
AHYKARDRKAAVPVVAGDRPEEENPVEIVPFDTPRVDLPDHLVEPLPPAGLWSTFFQRLKQVLLDSERKIFLLDVHKDVRIDPRTAARGGLIRVRRGKESFQVKIPSGAWNRMSLRIPQKGEASLFGSKRGDLFLNILVTRGARVSAEDLMFFYDLQVARERVTEGRVLTLNSVQGPIKFILPRTTADGQTFVLKSQPDSLDQGAVS